MKTLSLQRALALDVTRQGFCADCRLSGYETATLDGEVLLDGSLVALDENPLVLCASAFSASLTCEECEEHRQAAHRAARR